MVQATSQPKTLEQFFSCSTLTWDEFKSLQSLLQPQGVRTFYFNGEVALLTVSDLHGLISGNLGYLLEMYMLEHLIRFIGLEDFSIEIPGLASAQAGKAYCFDRRASIPDLAVEVVIKGERETKLQRYIALQVPEVWFWMDDAIRVYQLNDQGDRYLSSPTSKWFPDLDIQRLAIASTQEFRSDAIALFLGQ